MALCVLMRPSVPTVTPPLSIQEEALRAHLAAALSRQLPLTQGPYSLSLALLPEGERAMHGGQLGPVLYDSEYLSALLHFDGLDRSGAAWSIDQKTEYGGRFHASFGPPLETVGRIGSRSAVSGGSWASRRQGPLA